MLQHTHTPGVLGTVGLERDTNGNEARVRERVRARFWFEPFLQANIYSDFIALGGVCLEGEGNETAPFAQHHPTPNTVEKMR